MGDLFSFLSGSLEIIELNQNAVPYVFINLNHYCSQAGLRPICEFMTFNFAMQAIDQVGEFFLEFWSVDCFTKVTVF